MPDRRSQVADAALSVIGTQGSRGLTHQAVDRAAGVPAGTTSNYFRTRAALLAGVVGHLEDLDRATLQALPDIGDGPQSAVSGPADAAPAHGTPDAATLAAALSSYIAESTGPQRDRTRARYELVLAGVSDPQLAEPVTAARNALADWGARWLAAAGSARPREHAVALLHLVDGMILHELSSPGFAGDSESTLRAVLTGLLTTES